MLARLARHAVHISFYAVLEAGIIILLRRLGLDHLLWARIVQAIGAVYFVVSFSVLAGAELISDCLDAIDMVRRRITRR